MKDWYFTTNLDNNITNIVRCNCFHGLQSERLVSIVLIIKVVMETFSGGSNLRNSNYWLH